MNNINLEYDSCTMDSNILKEYYKNTNLYFYSITEDILKKKDLHGNEYEVNLIRRKVNSPPIKDKKIFSDIVNNIRKKGELIETVEYFMRGILPVDTKREIDKIVEYIQYYADWLGTIDVDDRLKHLIPNSYVPFVMNDVSSLSSFAPMVSAMLTVGTPIEIYVNETIMFAMNIIQECFVDAGCYQLCLVDSLHDIECMEMNVMTIFENSDLDSAVDALISTWSRTTLYHPLKQIIVQESIGKDFIFKLTERLNKFRWNLPKNYKIDDRLKKAKDAFVKSCVKDDVEHIKMDESFYSGDITTYFKPLVLMNSFHFDTRKNFGVYGKIIPVVNLQTFRTTKEAVSLINSMSPYAVSVWCDNSSIWNETALSSNIRCVWVNCYDYTSPAVNAPYKFDSRNMYIGGVFGLIGNMKWKSNSSYTPKKDIVKRSDIDVDKLIKMQESWKSTTDDKKAAVFINMANILNNNQDFISKLINQCKMTKADATACINDSIRFLKEAACLCRKIKNASYTVRKNVTCTEIVEPIGLVAIEGESNKIRDATLAAAAVMACGNGVIFSTRHSILIDICKLFANNGLPIMALNGNVPRFDAVKYFWKIADAKIADVNSSDEYSGDLCSDIEDIISLKEILEERFCYRKVIWNTYGETFSN